MSASKIERIVFSGFSKCRLNNKKIAKVGNGGINILETILAIRLTDFEFNSIAAKWQLVHNFANKSDILTAILRLAHTQQIASIEIEHLKHYANLSNNPNNIF